MTETTNFSRIDIELTHPQLGLDIKTTIPLDKGVIGLYGPSGHGKSNMLRMIAGLQSAPIARCYLIDNNLRRHELGGTRKLSSDRSPVVYQEQTSTLFTAMSVQKNLEFVQQHSLWSKQCSFSLQQVVQWCELQDLLTKSVQVLSGGEKQRVALARSLLSGKPILFLDEPFSALDWATRMRFMTLIKQLSEDIGLRIILVSHSLKELAVCSHYLVHLEHGKITKAGPTQALLSDLSIRKDVPTFSRLPLELDAYLATMGLAKWRLSAAQDAFVYTSEQQKPHGSIVIKTLDADKVSIAKSAPSSTSMLNHLSATITDIQPSKQMVLVTLLVGKQTLYSQISKLSLQHLDLSVGDDVQVLFKAI